MTRATYDVKEEYLGDGSLAAYTFDFKIEALTQLEVVEVDDNGDETERVRGDDTTYLSGVVFDAVYGGGTVTLAANLTTGYTLILLLANDAPTQAHEFRDKGSFSLKRIESALDFIAGAVQRLAYKGKQALRLHDSDDEETIDTQLPPDLAAALGKYLRVNDTGDGFEYGNTLAEFITAITPDGTIEGQVFTWGGSSWSAALRGGGMYVSAVQSIGAGAQITLNAAIQQLLKLQSSGGALSAALLPFASVPTDGTIVTLRGSSNSNTLRILYNDNDYGCMLKGDCTLGLNDTLTLGYDSADKRYWEISRN